MNPININKSKCAKDGLCAKACPMKLIIIDEKTNYPQADENNAHTCVKCGHCVSVCPHDAISIEGLSSESYITIDNKQNPSFDGISHALKSRRSIRNYKNKPVEKEKIESLLDIARFAPTGGNAQRLKWIAITSHEIIRSLADETINFMKTLVENDHPMAKAYNLSKLIDEESKTHDRIFRGAPALILSYAPKQYPITMVDSAIALTFIDTAAPSLGLGSCWVGFLMIAANQWKPISDILKISEEDSMCGALMLGYPAEKYYKIPPRKEGHISWFE